MDIIEHEIQQYRSKICNAFLITIAILAIPALMASLFRINNIGWQPVMAIHVFIATVLWIITLLRKRVPYNYQASFIIFMFLSIGLAGIYQLGLIAGGVVFLVAASPIATLLFGIKEGSIIFLVSYIGVIILAWLFINGNLKHEFDIVNYAVSPSSWITSLFGWALSSTALTVSLHIFNKNLIESLKISNKHQEILHNQNLMLEKTIKEKDNALAEIKTLQGIIPICSYCHSIRTSEDAWDRLEAYISRHSEAQFSHGICPKCLNQVSDDRHNKSE